MTQGLSTITDRYDYDAWGNEYPIMVSTADNPYRYVGQLGYYTHWMDCSLTDLLHLGVRFYEPGAGRFGQVDPLRTGLSWYLYINNRPLGASDPLGLAEWLRYDDKHAWYNWFLYRHAWLRFSRITCKGATAYGFWPKGIQDDKHKKGENYEIYSKYKPGDPNVFVEASNDSEMFERFLCDCIKESVANPPEFSAPGFKGYGTRMHGARIYVCGSWAKEMWKCAECRYSRFTRCRGRYTLPKTPPGGD